MSSANPAAVIVDMSASSKTIRHSDWLIAPGVDRENYEVHQTPIYSSLFFHSCMHVNRSQGVLDLGVNHCLDI